eukprot:g5065.t1
MKKETLTAIVRGLPVAGMALFGMSAAYRGVCMATEPDKNYLPHVFLKLEAVSMNGEKMKYEPLGTVVCELRSDVVPRTAENFRALCTHEHGYGYRRGKIHRITERLIQGGDIEYENGLGGRSIYGKNFEDENFTLQHKKGTITMANRGKKDTNNSQFVFLTEDAPWLDGEHVAFGSVVDGLDVLDSITTRYSKDGKNLSIRIVDCGEIEKKQLLH